jgi:hypothetical protein
MGSIQAGFGVVTWSTILAVTGMLDEPGLLEPFERGDGRRPWPPPEPDEVGETRVRVGAHQREQGLV